MEGAKSLWWVFVLVLCFVKSRNGLLVRLWFFLFSKVIYLERKSRRVGGVHIYRKYVASFLLCASLRSFF